MPRRLRPNHTKQTFYYSHDLHDVFEQVRKSQKLTQTAALEEALRDWSQRQMAGQRADLVAPLLAELINQRVEALEDRLVKLLIRIGYLATTNVELLLEQRRRSKVDMKALLADIAPRIDRRWRRPREFDDLPLPDAEATRRARQGTE